MIVKIAETKQLDEIDNLWKKNRATLGLMPIDAFRDAIRKRWILVCCDNSDNVKGYLQFRFTNRTQTIAIVHLCVCETQRGKNVAKLLLDELVKTYQNKVIGIKLSCRSDYKDAIRFWQKYNFQPKHSRPSRGKDPNIKLITWWYSFGKTDLFSELTSDKISVVLDFNIISKLRDNDLNSAKHINVEILSTEWVIDEVNFIITSETTSEIFRDKNKERNIQSSEYIKSYKELNLNKADINRVEESLTVLFTGKTENAISDRRQLAETILSGISYFITLDDEILKKASALEDQFGLKVFTPNNFVLEIDELKNSIDYYPARLSAENFSTNKFSSKDYSKVECFIDSLNENKKDLEEKIALIQSEEGELSIIRNGDNIISLIGHYIKENFLVVDLLRLVKHSLAKTVLLQNIFDIINYAASQNIPYISINDKSLKRFDQTLFEQFGFYFIENRYIKAVGNKVLKVQELSNFLEEINKNVPDLNSFVNEIKTTNITNSKDPWKYYFIEKKIWPLKISCDDLPTFIIPIKPHYATALFDTKSAKQTLFGASPKLIWNNENVYFRNVSPNIETVPARILWYASSDNKSPRQKSIVGISYLDEITIGPAKKLFKENKKYGVYEWEKHIKPLAKGDENKTIKVLKFSNSESFTYPIPYNLLIKILKVGNQPHNNFVSPVKIKSDIFTDIYKKGKGL